ncbi:hypothetical protein ACIQKE_02435 [Streptomyces griseoviridis]
METSGASTSVQLGGLANYSDQTSRGRGWTWHGRTVVGAMVWFQWSG